MPGGGVDTRKADGTYYVQDIYAGPGLARRGFVAFAPRCFLWQYRKADYLQAVGWLAERRPAAYPRALSISRATARFGERISSAERTTTVGMAPCSSCRRMRSSSDSFLPERPL